MIKKVSVLLILAVFGVFLGALSADVDVGRGNLRGMTADELQSIGMPELIHSPVGPNGEAPVAVNTTEMIQNNRRHLSDSNSNCPWWAQQSECIANPWYMLYNCRQSCKTYAITDECIGYYAKYSWGTCSNWGYGSCGSYISNPGCGHGWIAATCRKSCNTCYSYPDAWEWSQGRCQSARRTVSYS